MKIHKNISETDLYGLIIELWCKLDGRTLRTGDHLSTEALTKTMPIRETVAGEALSILSGSKTSFEFGDIIIRSPFARVSVLLSSSTEFKFSIHTASTGPSSTIHINSFFFNIVDLRQIVENIPSVQSLVATSNLPNICEAKIAWKIHLLFNYNV